jgi:hypothetical protein
VCVDEIYPGIGLVYYGNQKQLEYDFQIAPGANPDAIQIHFDGAATITINAQGELVVALNGGEIRQPRPVIYQTVNGARREISGGYRLGDAHTVAFAVGNYDHSLPLVIDPVLIYSAYFGGNAGETAWSVKTDANDDIYVAGQTFSSQFSNTVALATPGAYQTNYQGGTLAGDAFVAKFTGFGQALVYFTYFGGSGNDAAYGLAVDSNGDAYIAGVTDSTNFPAYNAIQTNISGTINPQLGVYHTDAFVAELDPSGSKLVFSTYLGGESTDAAFGVAVDSAGNVYVTGCTYSTNFPVKCPVPYKLAGTTNLFLNRLACTNTVDHNANAFITKITLTPDSNTLAYSTYFGGQNFDVGTGITVDSSNNVFVTGYTASTNFPTAHAILQQFFQTNFPGTTNQAIITNTVNGSLLNGSTKISASPDAFVARFDSTGTNLVYSTYLGGTNNDTAYGITCDAAGNACVVGATASPSFPNTVQNFITNGLANNLNLLLPATTNAFLTQITWNGTNAGIGYSAVFGGSRMDVGYGVAIDPISGNIFVVGSTISTNFPTYNIPGLLRATNSGKSDVFVTAFNPAATALLYSTYLGGGDNDYGYGIATAGTNFVFVVGQTLSANFPTNNAALGIRNGTNDIFLAAIMYSPFPPVLINQPASRVVPVGTTVFFAVNSSGTPPLRYQWQLNGTNLVDGTNLVYGGIFSGVTNATLFITNAQTGDSASYRVVITNYAGSAISDSATLLVTNVPPRISALQPTNQMVGLYSTASFAVTATGTAPLSYQWKLNGTNLVNGTNPVIGGIFSGVTNATLAITNVQLGDAGIYSVVVTNVTGIANQATTNGVLTVVALPQITNQPASLSNQVGALVTFSVGAVGQIPLSYQWQMTNGVGTNWVNLVNGGGHVFGATNSSLIISNAQTTNTGFYRVVVANAAGSSNSSPAFLRITNVPPGISGQPLSQTVGAGTTNFLTVGATGTAPLSYQWQFNGINLTNGGNISGVTTNTLKISGVTTNNGGGYSVIVTNAGGSVTSSNAILTVIVSLIITNQPVAGLTNQVGYTATFSVVAVGQIPLSYHWWFNGSSLANGGHIFGATSSSLTVSNAQTTNTGNYWVVITNAVGSVISSNAYLSITNVPPTITNQPTSQMVVVTSNATFQVAAIGTAPLHYQWQFYNTNNPVTNNLVNGGNISGATSNVLTFSKAQLTNNGYYFVVVTNAGGVVTSTVAQLTVAASPVITNQPADQANAVDATVTFSVGAIGTTPLYYQWQFNSNNLANGGRFSGVTSATLRLTHARTNDSGYYSVVITNAAGSVTSSNAYLTITNVPPNIIVQPASQTIAIGSNVTFTVSVSGTVPLSYQWWQTTTNYTQTNQLVNGGNISGTDTPALTITNLQTAYSGNVYFVVITNYGGKVTSALAVLTVGNTPPEITSQPTNQSVDIGTNATFAVTVTGTSPLSYQWWLNGTNQLVDGVQASGSTISGSTSNVLTISQAQTDDNGIYSVTVTNYFGSVTSSNAVLKVGLPVFTSQPQSQAIGVGQTVIFSANGYGAVPFTFQWLKNGTNLVDGGRISGATNVTLTITNVQFVDAGNYQLVVMNFVGATTSSNAVLTVTNLPPKITVQPTNQIVNLGSNVNFVVSATGSPPLSYQWWMASTNQTNQIVDGGNISGATSSTLAITNAQTTNSGTYFVVITNYGGSATSALAVLMVGNLPPEITAQPANRTNAVGATVIFSVTAIGPASMYYQWQFNGLPLTTGGQISVVTNASLAINNVQTTNIGNYSVVITNIYGSVSSSDAYLYVTNVPPKITLQPSNQIIALGSNMNFSVSVTGTSPFSYQWWMASTNQTNQIVDGGNISGAASSTLAITNAQTTNSGTYFVVITNYGGSAISTNAVLMVTNMPPEIITQPVSDTNGVGTYEGFSVVATGTTPLSYQWQLNGTNLVDGLTGHGSQIYGATSQTIIISPSQTNDSGAYRVIITNYFGSVTSDVAQVLITAAPVFTTQPTNQTVIAGATGTFVAYLAASHYVSVYSQWVKDGTNLVDGVTASGSIISNSTSDPLYIFNTQMNDAGNYQMIFTNIYGAATSSVAVLTVLVPPSIAVQPTNQTVAAGLTATFAVSATGTEPLSYQWQLNLTNLTDGGRILGATSNVLSISNVQTNDGGIYSVIITNLAGSATSSNAVLTVDPVSFAKIVAAGGGSFILSGGGGATNGTYYVLTSSNLLLRLNSWTPIATNQFDNNGDFIFTSTVPVDTPQLFYILQLP